MVREIWAVKKPIQGEREELFPQVFGDPDQETAASGHFR
jgi:hypothetical protein